MEYITAMCSANTKNRNIEKFLIKKTNMHTCIRLLSNASYIAYITPYLCIILLLWRLASVMIHVPARGIVLGWISWVVTRGPITTETIGITIEALECPKRGVR
jgi:hypothetical protein